jgi:murein L,D-transpeptidase YcbB/YkuD
MRRLAALLVVCALVAGCRPRVPLPKAVVVDGAKRAIAAAVESLQRGEPVVVGGETLLSTVVLPELYRRRDFTLAWTDRDARDDLQRAVQASFDDGLDPNDYHLAAIDRLRAAGPSTPEARAELDLLLTDAAVVLAYQVRFGKLGPVPVDGEWTHESAPEGPDLATVLQRGIDDERVFDTFEELKPRYPFYARLKAALAEYRRIEAAGAWVDVPVGGALKPGATDARVSVLRRRLAATGDLPAWAADDPSREYDATVEAGIRAFQERHAITPDGALGPATLRALDVPVGIRIDQIRATLERCRWVMHDPADRFVLVDIADYSLAVIDREVPIWRTRVIVGEKLNQTPSFRADMRSIVLNPKWTIPPGIMKKEILPALSKDPGYFKRKGYTWVKGQVVQPAGPRNPLGRIKLLLPNKHHVYLHDTPTKASFNRTNRTFSHGCVRVEHPFALAALALDDPNWTAEGLVAAASSGKTRTIVLKKPLPVLILYATASADPEGRVHFVSDVYERDPEVIRRLAEPVASRPRSEPEPESEEPAAVGP